ncbi:MULTISPECIES: NAD(P)/FAD-dependent oxidoreductase [unclassified Rhizobium]|uniref:NAD(P)/FAD-dependent oxidoreductase n=1 Tax=unclassified Rhizobium TaxID=2613769 RepID=UPI0006F96BD4|nr:MULTISPECIES: NAD(P)/FAD-dependent oxidoreductase [unclassified Rhizobium]KQV39355.1 NADH dehydrogenase [Rhizobium sp. Root1212]KRD35360.1 NADH dehydrogenase [Rhizobium sp. Root268]
MTDHHLVVVGGGFAGLQLVNDLKGVPIKITLIDRRNHHLFQPLLYQVATTLLATSEIAWPIRSLYRDRPEVQTLLGEVVAVDRLAKKVVLSSGENISNDTLVLATGATHAYFGRDDWEHVAPGLKTLEDATTIRRRVLLAFELAERARSEEEKEALLTFAIVGAGPTGVELAGIIAELAHRTLPAEFRAIDTRKTKVLLVEAGSRILSTFDEKLSKYAQQSLAKRGVNVLLGKPVTECTGDGVTVAENFIPCKTIIWAAGVKASPAARWLDVDADRAGRAIVDENLTVLSDPAVFVIGDTASVIQMGKHVPGIAPAAKQQGAYVAKVIKNRLVNKQPPSPFRYRHQGSLATIGNNSAIIDFGKLKLRGWLAWWVWGFAHIYFLIGTRRRFAVAWSWLWISISGQHSARLITQRETIRDAT